MNPRYDAASLIDFGARLLDVAGMDHEKSITVAEVLVEADLMGHDTHGMHLIAPYLSDIEKKELALTGSPGVIADRPAAVVWDGRRLPGPWLVRTAIDLACERAKINGACIVSIRRSHHIACLAAYFKRVTDQNLMIMLSTSAPENQSVAPFGGRAGVLTPNPIAAAWPTDTDPVMIDVSMSITTNGMVARLNKHGGKLPGPWLIDAQGQPTDDPSVVMHEHKGALLPIGGIEYGHKGYALGLLVEALTQGLAGHGRADPIEGWTGEVFLQVFDPALFSGLEHFKRQTTWMVNACRNAPPRPGVSRVRLPGENGLKKRAEQLANGVALHPTIMPQLSQWARKLNVPLPSALV